MFKQCLLASSIVIINASVWAQTSNLPIVAVEESPWPLSVDHTISGASISAADTAEALKAVPGAAVNRNGGLTGIAQYRGMYGDRLAVSIDGASIVTGGPNAMDAPLSYIPASLLDELSVNRGAASVSLGQETLGGFIAARSHMGDFTDSADMALSARIHSDWNSQNRGSHSSVQVVGANDHHKLGINSSYDSADDSEFDGGTIDATEYQRRRHDLFYGYRAGDTQISVKLGKNNTGESGTPALAMDIVAIDSDLASLNASSQWHGVTITWDSSYSDVFHVMDNYSLRPQPMMGPRKTLADGRQITHKLTASLPLEHGSVQIGSDYSASNHSAYVTNPAMAMFLIENFNNAERDIHGLFAQWQQTHGAYTWELGARVNRVSMDADEVSAFLGSGTNGMMNMSMMTTMAGVLANDFNNADRSITDTNGDLVFKLGYQLNSNTRLNASLSSKQRAPSYQERYLWLPMQSTGGLADGHTYVGNLELDSEQANEINLGIDWQGEYGFVALQGFYRQVNDYIQGTPYEAGNNMMVNNAIAMFANMMSGGNPPLQYNNIDAKLYGGELSYGWQMASQWSLTGQLSYVRGKRTDSSDDLYRLAPLNHRLALGYTHDGLELQLISELFAAQNKVSQYNNEQATSGFGLLHLAANYPLSDALHLRAGIDNLTDKRYQDHLAGYNRVGGNDDIAVGERLYGTGRSVSVGMTYQW